MSEATQETATTTPATPPDSTMAAPASARARPPHSPVQGCAVTRQWARGHSRTLAAFRGAGMICVLGNGQSIWSAHQTCTWLASQAAVAGRGAPDQPGADRREASLAADAEGYVSISTTSHDVARTTADDCQLTDAA